MKILNLRFKNLNSLYGEWNIDFTDSSYLNDGIFAITGPTGAGKSTVLDAICLGLYGSTPRLQKINNNSNDIMSRNTGECFSEVTFKTGDVIYRSYWAQHRAHRKADGKLTDSTHEVSNGEDGSIITNKKSEVKTIIEEITGMDIERFTRSALLAQGSFSAFLKASSDQKSKILQQITGTDIYSRISVEVHRRKGLCDQELKVMKAQIGETLLLSQDEEAELHNRKSKILEEEKITNSKAATARKGIEIKELYNITQVELESLNTRFHTLLEEDKQLRPMRQKLSMGKKALGINSLYIQLMEKRGRLGKVLEELNGLKLKLPILKKEKDSIIIEVETFEADFCKFRTNMEKEERLIAKVRQLDFELRELEGKKNESNKRVEDARAILVQNEVKEKKLFGVKESIISEIEKINSILKNFTDIDVLQDQINEVRFKTSSIKSNYNRVKNLETKLNNLNEEIDGCESLKSEINYELESFIGKQVSIKTELEENRSRILDVLNGSSIKEIRSEKEFLIKEASYIGKIISLEEERKRLMDGTPCPLCGSLEHPFSVDGIPEKDDVEKKLELLERKINEIESLEEKSNGYESGLMLIGNEVIKIENKAKELDTKLKSFYFGVKETEEEISSLIEDNLNKFEGIKSLLKLKTGINEANYEDVLRNTQDNLAIVKELTTQKSEKDRKLLEVGSEIKGIKVLNDNKSADIEKESSLLNELDKTLNNKKGQRIELFGERITQEVELELKKQLNKEVELSNKLKEKLNRLESNYMEISKRIAALEKEHNGLNEFIGSLDNEFMQGLEAAKFKSVDEFKESKLGNLEIEKLENSIRDFDNRLVEVKTGIKDRESKLEELEKNLKGDDLGKMKSELLVLDNNLKELRGELGSITEKIDVNEKAKEKFKEQQLRIEKQVKESQLWARIHGLIGSNDGKKFRNFAQGLTFEIMVSHANKQLRKMSDRYLLVRDDNLPLELNVIDNYLAGESRTSRNLSGGESFIISLALALGLSSMASDKVQVDSLFLDEGFGTLDKDSLDIALDTLLSLHQEGKMIGIISHVPAIKERIPTQISVLPLSGGRSKLSGPGCS